MVVKKKKKIGIEGLEMEVSSYASSWSQDFDRLHKRVEKLEHRVNAIEDKWRS